MHIEKRTRALTLTLVIAAALTSLAVFARSESVRRDGGTARVETLVTRASAACTKTSPTKTGRVTPLAAGQNAFLARLEMDPFAKVPEHRDDTEEYIHVLSGAGTMWIDDERTSVAPGDTVFMPAGAKVRFENGSSSMIALQVFAGPGPAEKYRAWTGCTPASP